jgi:UrcA family protein
MKVSILCAALTWGVACICTAGADEVPSVRVSLADLNPATAAGREDMYRRIEAAAATVCDPLDDGTRRSLGYAGCEETAIKNAIAQVPALANYDVRPH